MFAILRFEQEGSSCLTIVRRKAGGVRCTILVYSLVYFLSFITFVMLVGCHYFISRNSTFGNHFSCIG